MNNNLVILLLLFLAVANSQTVYYITHYYADYDYNCSGTPLMVVSTITGVCLSSGDTGFSTKYECMDSGVSMMNCEDSECEDCDGELLPLGDNCGGGFFTECSSSLPSSAGTYWSAMYSDAKCNTEPLEISQMIRNQCDNISGASYYYSCDAKQANVTTCVGYECTTNCTSQISNNYADCVKCDSSDPFYCKHACD